MKIFKISLLVLVTIIVVSCKKTNVTQPAVEQRSMIRFYSSNLVTSTKLISVTVNGVKFGRLKYSATSPDCSADGFASTAVLPGVYRVGYVDEDNPQSNKVVEITVTSSLTCQFFNIK